ncbi:MAG: sigma-70 family RNA polymerase sigma factor [Hyphomicrobiaceae bacterium]
MAYGDDSANLLTLRPNADNHGRLEQGLPAAAKTDTKDLIEMSDHENLERVADRRDSQAFRELFEKYGPLVKGFMMRQGTNAATAEELAQETMLMVWHKAGQYSREKGNVPAWIFAIARNLRIDRLRREKTWVALEDHHFIDEASAAKLPDEVLSIEQQRLSIKIALDGLPSDQREIIVLSFVEGLSHSAIAQKLGLPIGTVKSRIRLAYIKLRGAVGACDHDD